MRDSVILLLFSLRFILGAIGFSLFDEQHSYVQFERWRDKADGKIGVSFRIKTYVESGLLFYVDDQAQNSEYLTLYLRHGFLILQLRDEKRKVFTARSKVSINDLEWHRIDIELSPHHAAFGFDNSTQAEFNISKTQLKSDVYIGGLPNDIDIFLLSYDDIIFEKRFLGCVENVLFSCSSKAGNFTQSSAKVLRSSGMGLKCKDACKPINPCQSNGVCINKFAMAECSCTGTGYRGKTCEKESPVVGIASTDHRVIFDVRSSYVVASPETTSMFIRFRSTQANGVFFYTTHKGDYILLELANGTVAASVNLGSGSVTITTKKSGFNDNQWHRVRLERVKRLVNLTVDNLDTSKGETRGNFDKFHLPKRKTSFYLGGLADDKKTQSRSVSGKNFTGCLQELIFNGYDVFWKFNTSAKDVVSRGKFLKTCPKITTTTKITTTGNLSQLNVNTNASFSSKTTEVSDVSSVSLPTTNQKLSCILAGTSCKSTTTGDPVSQTHVMTSTQENTAGTWRPTTGKRFFTSDQSTSSFESLNQSTVGADGSKTTPTSFITSSRASETSQNPSRNKSYTTGKDSTSRPFPTDKKGTQNSDLRQTTREVIMAKRNERNEGDLTVWFILAAVVGLVAFILAISIIVKVNSTSRKTYAVKGKNYEKDYWADTGSFQRSSKPLV